MSVPGTQTAGSSLLSAVLSCSWTAQTATRFFLKQYPDQLLCTSRNKQLFPMDNTHSQRQLCSPHTHGTIVPLEVWWINAVVPSSSCTACPSSSRKLSPAQEQCLHLEPHFQRVLANSHSSNRVRLTHLPAIGVTGHLVISVKLLRETISRKRAFRDLF